MSRSLGHGPVRTFLSRHAPPAAARRPPAAALLVALYVLSDFGAVSLLRYDTFTRGHLHLLPRQLRPHPGRGAQRRAGGDDRRAGRRRGPHPGPRRVRPDRRGHRTPGRPGPARAAGGRPRSPGARAVAAAGASAFPLGTSAYWLAVGTSADLGPRRARRRPPHHARRRRARAPRSPRCWRCPVGVIAARYRGRDRARCWSRPPTPGTRCPASSSRCPWSSSPSATPTRSTSELPLLVCAYAVLFLPVAVAATRRPSSRRRPCWRTWPARSARTPWRVPARGDRAAGRARRRGRCRADLRGLHEGAARDPAAAPHRHGHAGHPRCGPRPASAPTRPRRPTPPR